MKCPECKCDLVLGELKEYETLVDHVTNPNADSSPLRKTYVCPNSTCELYEQVFWDDMGSLYPSTRRGSNWCIKASNTYAVDSFYYDFNRDQNRRESSVVLDFPTEFDVIGKLVEALREAKAWAMRGEGTPEQNGAKCETLTEALQLIDSAISLGNTILTE